MSNSGSSSSTRPEDERRQSAAARSNTLSPMQQVTAGEVPDQANGETDIRSGPNTDVPTVTGKNPATAGEVPDHANGETDIRSGPNTDVPTVTGNPSAELVAELPGLPSSKPALLPERTTIGIVGGGQLGQMMAESARDMGFKTIILDPAADCPAAQVADEQIVAQYSNEDAIRELADSSDVVTYEFENVDADVLDRDPVRVKLPQGTASLRVSQDRLAEKRFVERLGIPLVDYRPVSSREELERAAQEVGYPCVLKTTRGGYDGKGQRVLRSEVDLEDAAALVQDSQNSESSEHIACVLEAWAAFTKEISVLVVGDGTGKTVVFPVSENEHRNNILHLTTAPARIPGRTAATAQRYASTIAETLKIVGMLAVEMFVTAEGAVLVNELAPRPHNSGHWTIEGCSVSQFAEHIRAVAGMPLVEPELVSSAVMINVLGQHLEGATTLSETRPTWVLHDYGKSEARPNRKVGHITILGDDPQTTIDEIEQTSVWGRPR
ncbi:5-(carboxyamino)imidazole ribonucleotide synthase [Actinomycetaceae bacterium MB13-C1-2]|nr:5-(carboxyamino)imidazole ribonucleotide synthase [Actinomycetaceae bacterium MB13-C1-2]